MDAENEGVKNDDGAKMNSNALPPERKGYCLRNPPTVNYNEEISNGRSMEWINLIVCARALHNFSKAYVNVINATTTFLSALHQPS